METRIKLGISACLLGERVRYDGQHKLDHFLADTLGRFVDFVPVCPEVECGLGVPREAMRLVGDPAAPRLMTQKTGIDLTDRMQAWIGRRIEALREENLCGFIFKAKSPSSGMERVKIYNVNGQVGAYGAGLFAGAFMRAFPLLPVEDEGRLHDDALRENFIERVFTLARYREAVGARPTLAALMAFHARHKYLLMAHAPAAVESLGRELAQAPRKAAAQAARAYEQGLMAALARLPTPHRHANVLQHMLGYFKSTLSDWEKRELLDVIGDMKRQLIPLIAPVTLIAHYARKYDVTYLADQVYLHPHPTELKLRNHA